MSEIISPQNEDVVCLVSSQRLFKAADPALHPLLCLVISNLPAAIIISTIDKAGRRVVFPVSMCKDLCCVPLRALGTMEFWLPDKFKVAIHKSSLIVVICVHSCKENSLHSHICHQTCVDIWVSKRVKLPANLRRDTKLISKPVMTFLKIAEDVRVICGCLIWRHEAALDKFKLSLLEQRL